MKTVFIIGGSGFSGRTISRYLSNNFKVIVFDKYIDKEYFSKYPSIQTVEIDLIENKLPLEYNTPDFIINLVSIVTAERDMSLFDGLISTNLKVLLNLFERFKNESELKLFIQFGTSEEYGSDHSPFKEDMRENPSSPYALVKQFTTNTTMMLHQNYKFPAMVVRPGNLFGPFQHESKFIPYIITQLLANKELNVSPCEQKRDFIHVEDFSFIIEELLLNYNKCVGEIVNTSSGESISLKNIIDYCKKETNSVSKINYGALPYRENEVMDLRCSVEKLSSIIGQEIKFDIKKRLLDCINDINS